MTRLTALVYNWTDGRNPVRLPPHRKSRHTRLFGVPCPSLRDHGDMPLDEETSAQSLAEHLESELPQEETEETTAPETSESTEEQPEQEETEATQEGDFGWRKIFQERTGLDMSKYADEWSAMDGVAQAIRWASQKNDDAKLGEQIRGREQEVMDFLNGRQQQAEPQSTEQPMTVDEARLVMSQVRTDEQGNLVALPGAPPDAVQKVRKLQEAAQRATYALALDPEQVLGPLIDKRLGKVNEQFQQQLGMSQQQIAEQAAMQQWAEQNKNWLFVNGDRNQPTPIFQHLDSAWREVMQSGVQSPYQALRIAHRMIAAQVPQPKPAKKPSPGAQRKPNVARPTTPGSGLPPNATMQDVVALALGSALGEIPDTE